MLAAYAPGNHDCTPASEPGVRDEETSHADSARTESREPSFGVCCEGCMEQGGQGDG